VYTAESPTFGLLLKRHRRAAGLTQEELAEKAGVSPRAIGDLERDLRQPRRDTLQLLLAALELSPNEASRLSGAARVDSSRLPGQGTQAPLLTGSFLGAAPTAPMVGRQHEIYRLLATVDTVVGGSGRLVLLTGEPGVGKTRLAQEVSLEVARRDFLVASGRCYEPERDVPFYPFLEALAAAYARAPESVREAVPSRWPQLALLLPPGTIANPDVPRGTFPGGAGEEQQLLWAVSGFLSAISADRPVAVLVDDLHWADDASLKLLLHLARRMRGQSLLLLGTYRDVELEPQQALARALVDLNRERLVERVTVGHLDVPGTAEFILSSVGKVELPPDFVSLIHRATSGNPFFIQEVVLALIERGDIFPEAGRWKCRHIEGFQTPETVRAAIGERLGRLHTEAQATLYRACVLGQSFRFDDLRALGNSAEEELDRTLEAAISAGLIREDGTTAYAFTHALTQQALYDGLSARRRSSLHLAAGEALLRLPAAERQQRVAELAWHFREAGDTERAVEYTVQAGDRAAEAFAYGEAERLFRLAAGFALGGESAPPGTGLAALALAKLGRVLDHTERYDEALTVLEQAAGLYRSLGDRMGEAAAVAEIGWIHRNRGTDGDGLALVSPLVASLEAENSGGHLGFALAGLYTALSRLYFGLGRYVDELEAAQRAVDLARNSGNTLVLSVAESRLGGALMFAGRREEAREALEKAIVLGEGTGNLGTMTVALDNLGEIARDAGDYRQALLDCQRAVVLAEQTGVPGRIGWTLTKLGRIHLLMGEWAQARALFERALHLLGDDPRSAAHPMMYLGQLDLVEGNLVSGSAQVEAAMGIEGSDRDPWLGWRGTRLLAELNLLEGNPATALSRLQELVEHTGEGQPQGSVMFTLLFGPLAFAYVELGQEDEAEAILANGLARAEAKGQVLARAELLRIRGTLRSRQRRWEEARRDMQESLELVRPMPNPFREAQARVALGELALQMHLDAEAEGHFRSALDIFQRLGARAYAERVERRLAALSHRR
jgi:tetratricopeptide (TPR) repeat protein